VEKRRKKAGGGGRNLITDDLGNSFEGTFRDEGVAGTAHSARKKKRRNILGLLGSGIIERSLLRISGRLERVGPY